MNTTKQPAGLGASAVELQLEDEEIAQPVRKVPRPVPITSSGAGLDDLDERIRGQYGLLAQVQGQLQASEAKVAALEAEVARHLQGINNLDGRLTQAIQSLVALHQKFERNMRLAAGDLVVRGKAVTDNPTSLLAQARTWHKFLMEEDAVAIPQAVTPASGNSVDEAGWPPGSTQH